jgi:hypothetical protein
LCTFIPCSSTRPPLRFRPTVSYHDQDDPSPSSRSLASPSSRSLASPPLDSSPRKRPRTESSDPPDVSSLPISRSSRDSAVTVSSRGVLLALEDVRARSRNDKNSSKSSRLEKVESRGKAKGLRLSFDFDESI